MTTTDWPAADRHHHPINSPHAAPLALPLVQGSGAQMAQLCGPSINRREIRRTSPGCAGRKQAVFSNKITVKPVLGKDLIGFETDIYGQVAMRVASLQDQIVRDQLIAAGWTPPGAGHCESIIKAALAIYMLRGWRFTCCAGWTAQRSPDG